MTDEPGFIPPHGSYRDLLSYQKAEVIYDVTFRFCDRFLVKPDRTIDQMVQAARSGKQNIAEGSQASGTSKETEIKLTNVARASLEELLIDYEDFLRVRDLKLWNKDSAEAVFVRDRARQVPLTFEVFREFVESRAAEVVANIAICLIRQANYLLDRQLAKLESAFIQEGGMRERMTKARVDFRNRQRDFVSGRSDGSNGNGTKGTTGTNATGRDETKGNRGSGRDQKPGPGKPPQGPVK